MIRRCLEIATRRLVFRRRLPQRYGGRSFYASTEGGLKYLKPSAGRIEPCLMESARDTVRPGDVVWDVGANVGMFSAAAAGLAGREGLVYAIEPDTEMVRLLRRSAALRNDSAPMHVIPVAVSDGTSLAEFQIATRARAMNHLAGFGCNQTGGVREAQSVMTVSLDWLAQQIPAPQVIKIDTEGAELRVLRGGYDLLTRHHPIVLCEVGADNADAVSRLLADCGYELHDADAPGRPRVEVATWNTLALPA
jgi:FkbM family methyltransferase